MSLDTHSDTGLDDDNEGMEVNNDTTNGDFPGNINVSNGNIFDFDAEYHLSDAPSSPPSWLDIGTSPPSPPPSPFQLSDGDVLQDEEGFADITAEDYLEHDRCYTADSRTEFDEMTTDLCTNSQSGLPPNIRIDPGYSCATGGRYNQGVDGSDCIRSAVTANPLLVRGKRDNTFVRYHYDKDRNIDQPRKEPDMYLATEYGRLDFILALTPPSDPRFGIEE